MHLQLEILLGEGVHFKCYGTKTVTLERCTEEFTDACICGWKYF